MAGNFYQEYAIEQRKELGRLVPRLLLFSLLLIIVHALEVKPGDIDVGGVKVVVKDVAILRGGVALVFLYHLCMVILAGVESETLHPMPFWPRVIRSLIKSARKPYRESFKKRRSVRSIKEVKRSVRASIIAIHLVSVPLAVAAVLITCASLVLAIPDVVRFCSLLIEAPFAPGG